MATIYVYSGATGLNNGTSWANAYTSIASATGAAAGDDVYVASDHDQNVGATSLSLNFSSGGIDNPVRILSVARADDSLTAGAVIRSNTGNNNYDLTLQGNIFVHGITFQFASDFFFNQTTDVRQIYESCSFAFNGDRSTTLNQFMVGGDSTNTYIYLFRNCTIDWSAKTANAVDGIRITRNAQVRFFDLSVVPASASMPAMLRHSASNGFKRVFIENSDISAFGAFVDAANFGEGIAVARRCKIGAAQTAVTGTKSYELQEVLLESCDDGTITVPPLGLHTLDVHHGSVKADLSRYRTGGADDGEQANAYSWEMASNANAVETYVTLESPPMVFWMQPHASPSGAEARGVYTSTRMAPIGTPTALTTDAASTWNGTGVGTKQKISHSLSNGQTVTIYVASGGTLNNDDFWIEVCEPDQVGGPATIRCYLAKPSTTIYVDPKPEVT